MITSYEVGTIFKIVDRATPVVSNLTKAMLRLDEVTTRTQKRLQSIGAFRLGELSRSIGSVTDQAVRMDKVHRDAFKAIEVGSDKSTRSAKLLANEWRDVAAAARMAGAAVTNTARANAAAAWVGPWGAIPRGHGPNPQIGPSGRSPASSVPLIVPGSASPSPTRRLFGFRANQHVPVPGGTHLGVHGRGPSGNAALMGAGILGYSVYQEAQIEDIAARALMTGQIKVDGNMRHTDAFKHIREVIRKNAAATGFSPKEVGEAVLKTERQLGGLSFEKRLELENTILPYAAIEARMKESNLAETFEAMVGMSHMTGTYDPKKLPELMRQFSYASMITPVSVPQYRSALSYSMPVLTAGLNMDPGAIMFLTAMTQTAGITNTKSGTWIRSFFERLMPQSGIAMTRDGAKHNAALQQMGLLGPDMKPTWQVKDSSGQVDWMGSLLVLSEKMNTALKGMPDEKRLSMLTGVFGERGGGFGALMNLKEFIEQFPILMQSMKNWKGGGEGILEYLSASPVQQGRQVWSELQNVLMDIGNVVLPPVVTALGGFRDGLKQIAGPLEWIVSHMPKTGEVGGPPKKGTLGEAIGKGMAVGSAAGFAAGWLGGPTAPISVPLSTGIGAVLGGGAYGLSYLANEYLPFGTGNGADTSGKVKTVPVPGGAPPVGPTPGMFHRMSYSPSSGGEGYRVYGGGRYRMFGPASGGAPIIKASLGPPGSSGLSILPNGGITDADSFNKAFKGTALEGHWSDVVTAAKENGVSPNLMAAIMAHETGRGSNLNGNNVAGLMDPATGWSTKQRFESIGDGISAAGRTIGKNWKKSDGNLHTMAGIYAPKGAANDPKGLNGGWESGVRKFLGNGMPLGQDAALAMAMQHFGESEHADRASLASFFRKNGYNVDPKITAWCATFVNSSLGAAGMKGTGSNIATSFMKWGKSVDDLSQVKAGDVLVKHRGRLPGQTGGHVGFATGQTRMRGGRMQLEMLSGNENDAVGKKWYDADGLVGRRSTESPAVIPPKQDKQVDTPVTLHLDGRVIARSTMKQMVRMGNGPARGPRLYDSSAVRPINV